MMYAEELAVHPRPAQAPASRKRRRQQKRLARLEATGGTRLGNALRRGLAMILLIAMIWGLIWLFSVSAMAEPLMAMITPWYATAIDAINDPLGVDWAGQWAAIAILIIPHLGILMWFLDET